MVNLSPLSLCRTGALFGLLAASAAAQVPVDSLPFVITEPGSYQLTQNLGGAQGIVVSASHVTLDLGGFVLAGNRGNAADGIVVRGPQTNLEVRNGTISGWGMRGIMADEASNSSFHDLRLSENGLCGIRAGTAAVIERLVSQTSGAGSGIVVFDAGVITDSVASGNRGWGIDAGACSVITNNSVYKNDGGGILAFGGSRVSGNSVQDNGHGFEEGGDVLGCSTVTLGGTAFFGSGSYIEDNVITGNKIGLHLLNEGNVVARNVVKGNEDNYDIVPGNQLEILLCELPEDIDWPATVKVSGTLTGVEGQTGLDINADGVTVDLDGHSLVGVPGSMCGIFVGDTVRDLAVLNGILADWGGCGLRGTLAAGSRVEGVLAKGNGLSGIRIGVGSVVEQCVARSNALDGILTQQDCVVTGSVATVNGNDGINVGSHSSVVNSVASENVAFGIRTLDGSQVMGSTSSSNNLGIFAGSGSSVFDNTASQNFGVGIRMEARCFIRGNTLQGNDIGLFTSDGQSRIEGNTMAGNTSFGLNVQGTSNLVLGNSASGNGTNFLIGGGNAFGPILDVAGVGEVGAADPWSNFAF